MSSCNILISDLGYTCRDLSDDVSQLISPFTKGLDGELIGVYVQRLSGDKYRISDGGNMIAHMLTHDIKLNRKRLDELQIASMREGVELTDMGELATITSTSSVTDAVNRVLTACLEAGHLEKTWLKSTKIPDFTAQVGQFLASNYKKVIRNPMVRALSGHQIEIAFGVESEQGTSYVQPVGSRSGKLSWSAIYRVCGMMNDLREIEARRFVVVDDNVQASMAEMGEAVTALSEHSTVLPFTRRESWLHEIAA